MKHTHIHILLILIATASAPTMVFANPYMEPSYTCFQCSSYWLDWFFAGLFAALFIFLYEYGLLSSLMHKASGKGKGPCEKEKTDKAVAEQRFDEAMRQRQNLEKMREDAQDASNAAENAEAKAKQAEKSAGGRWTADATTNGKSYHREGWKNKEAGKEADAAREAANSARKKAEAAQKRFEDAGGDQALDDAKNTEKEAQDNLDAASNALNICLKKAAAPKPEAKPQPKNPEPVDMGGTSVTTPPPSNTTTTRPRKVCDDGQERNNKTESKTFRIIDLTATKVMHSGMYNDPEEMLEFIEYLDFLHKGFFAAKSVKGFATKPGEASLGAAGFPDFLTYYQKMGEEALKGMRKIAGIMKQKSKVGDWWLSYPIRSYTLSCKSKEVCKSNAWVGICDFSMEELPETRTFDTKKIQVEDPRQVTEVIDRLFRQLEGNNNRALQNMRSFKENCK